MAKATRQPPRRKKTMNRTLRSITLAAATFVLASTASTAAHAEHAVLGVAIGGGALTQVHYQPQIYAPQPYYYRQPIIYAPAPVYYPRYDRGWERHEHRRHQRRWERERQWEREHYDRRY
jgi:hypothetical protein